MANSNNRGKLSNSFARGFGIVLVATLSGLLLVGFSSNRHAPYSMMGQGYGYRSTSSVCAPPNFTGQVLTVNTVDMGMMGGARRMALQLSSDSVAAGKLNIVVQNLGMRTHEVVILPLAAGQTVGARIVGSDGKIDEAGSLGEVSNNCGSGAGEGISSGSMGWASFALRPGRYELVCNLPNHYAAGMYQELVVTA
jgi:uncharacterized cupredoxin-like copper-binding protein